MIKSVQEKKSFFAANAILFLLCMFFIITGCDEPVPVGEQTSTIQDHVEWLSHEDLGGRLAGTRGEASAANYIADQFLQSGLLPAGNDGTYFQQFVLEGPIPQAMGTENHISRNVVARIEGTEENGELIIVGAHYDSQGRGGMISMEMSEEPVIHPGADDNASGTAGMLWLADYFSNREPSKDIIFIAFAAEEMGLLGSRYFAEHMQSAPDNVVAMINLDMIGRMDDNQLTIFGTGTAEQWDDILNDISRDSLHITRTPAGSGASDHLSFFEVGIPVLHYFTGTHEDYHRPTDTADNINYNGIRKIAEHAAEVIKALDDKSAAEMGFIESTDPRSTSFDFEGPTLGVLPDYTYSGAGFRIDGIREGDAAERAGIQRGDVILKMGDFGIGDIYDYMESLSVFQQGDDIRITILRNGEEIELEVSF
ncbi:M20/M25/M40 family metallo-hydrolase [soil metagenome]